MIMVQLKGYRMLVVEQEGRVTIIDNPKWSKAI